VKTPRDQGHLAGRTHSSMRNATTTAWPVCSEFSSIRMQISQLYRLSVCHAMSTRLAVHWRVSCRCTVWLLVSSCKPDKIGKSVHQWKGCCSTV